MSDREKDDDSDLPLVVINLEVNPPATRRLEEMREFTKADSVGAVIMEALRRYEVVLSKSAQIPVVVPPNADLEVIVETTPGLLAIRKTGKAGGVLIIQPDKLKAVIEKLDLMGFEIIETSTPS